MRIITEPEFALMLRLRLSQCPWIETVTCVTGPGRSGAIASVYTSHILGVPFLPFGVLVPSKLADAGILLIIDTATESGATLRKASRRYEAWSRSSIAVFNERDPQIGRVAFWYESPKPQRYKHEVSR